MDIEYLKRFVHLAEMERISFSQAAVDLNLPQPHLSQQIQKLEKEIGVQLFDRKRRPPKLTRAGQEFFKKVRVSLEYLEEAKLLAKQAHDGHAGTLSVGINNSVSNCIFSEILRDFKAKLPAIEINLCEMASYDQLPQIRNLQLDLGFFHSFNLSGIEDEISFEKLSIMQETLVIALPERHPLAKKDSIKIAELRDERFILPSSNLKWLHTEIKNLCLEAGFHPQFTQTSSWITTFLGLVASEMGIAIVPSNAQKLQRLGVIYRPIDGYSSHLEIVAIWHRENPSSVLKNFLEFIKLSRY